MADDTTSAHELLLATLSESMRAQRGIIELLREVRTELAQLRAQTAEKELVPVTLFEESEELAGEDAPETPAAPAGIPVLKTLVNADGSTRELDKATARHLSVVD